MLGRVAGERGWYCLAYCLMENHVHLLLETPQPNLAAGMHQLQGVYAQLFNKRHSQCGHVFQGRYGSVLVRSDRQLWTVITYIARNPVKAGLCEAPGHWAWSSHRSVLGDPSPSWLDTSRLLGHLHGAGDPRERYSRLVDGRGSY